MSYTFPFTKNVIELGGGDNPYFRPNVDVRSGDTVDVVADFNQSLPLTNSTYDGVFSCYCIEHLSWRKVKLFVSEVFRILRQEMKIPIFLSKEDMPKTEGHTETVGSDSITLLELEKIVNKVFRLHKTN